jgi:hypothetical protein
LTPPKRAHFIVYGKKKKKKKRGEGKELDVKIRKSPSSLPFLSPHTQWTQPIISFE